MIDETKLHELVAEWLRDADWNANVNPNSDSIGYADRIATVATVATLRRCANHLAALLPPERPE